MDWRIPLFKIYWDKNDVSAVTSIIEKGANWAIGPELKEFEKAVAEYIGVKYAVAVNSGTSALHVALAAHGIGPGDEVIVPAFTFIATANAPLFVGATPVFAEIEEQTFGLDPDDVERKITPRTKAIIPVHYGGIACQIDKLKRIAEKHKLILIEDAAESFGSAVNGRKLGSIGDSAILSFCSAKVITTGEGGMVLTNSRDVYEKAKLVYSHGRAETADYFSTAEQMEYITLGYNFRMSTMTAALGLSQVKKVDDIIRMRRENAEYLTEKLSGIKDISTPALPPGCSHVYMLYTIRLKNQGVRDRLKDHLTSKGILSRIYFNPVHLSQFYRKKFGYKEGLLPVTEKIASEVLTLPMSPPLTHKEIDSIAREIKVFLLKGN
ncbi:MAG: DegT/DnrJ/EryC1/StrS family aminotransferase [Dehalococcoidales bacterium]|nr:DegT/DnrJ/EryC1/StrS family aminotransferase [Dehalococcoidales bacterium]